jgi:tetratricopeptide (TPR) repeat protein
MWPPYARLALFTSLFVTVTANQLWPSAFETWKANDQAAAAATKVAHFADAEKLLLANEKLAETFPPKDARLPRTIFDLAQVYRAEGKYSDALPLYERAMQIYTNLYGRQSPELAETLDGEAELFKSLNDYSHAEPLLLKSLALRQKLLAADSGEVAQRKMT